VSIGGLVVPVVEVAFVAEASVDTSLSTTVVFPHAESRTIIAQAARITGRNIPLLIIKILILSRQIKSEIISLEIIKQLNRKINELLQIILSILKKYSNTAAPQNCDAVSRGRCLAAS